MKFVIIGGSGFVGSSLVKSLLDEGHKITVYDPLSKESKFRLNSIIDKIDYKKIDLENLEVTKSEITEFDVVVHFSATASTALGQNKTDVDLKSGIISTYNILEAMRVNGIKKIIYSSAPAVYGYPIKIPTSEKNGMLFPISLYGASKLSSEGLISAFCHLFDIKAWIFRFGNVVGPEMTRGVIRDFFLKLKQNQSELEVLGDGKQQKDVIFIDDCINGILFAFKNSNDIINIFNLSSGTTISVNKIAELVIKEMNLKNVKIKNTVGKGGWKGDPPIIHLDISKIRSLGWKPCYNSHEAVKLAIKGIL